MHAGTTCNASRNMGYRVAVKTIALIVAAILWFPSFSVSAQAFENTIYVSFNSKAGHFADATYQLEQYRITLKHNKLLINGKQVLNVLGKQTIEIFVDKNIIYLQIDHSLKIIPEM